MNNLRSASAASKPKIRFRWFGVGGGSGCTKPLGICKIIRDSEEANAEAIITGNKYVIFPNSSDNGITSDGYLPIFEDLNVDENLTIKNGIYKAYYDYEQGKYTAVALDIK